MRREEIAYEFRVVFVALQRTTVEKQSDSKKGKTYGFTNLRQSSDDVLVQLLLDRRMQCEESESEGKSVGSSFCSRGFSTDINARGREMD